MGEMFRPICGVFVPQVKVMLHLHQKCCHSLCSHCSTLNCRHELHVDHLLCFLCWKLVRFLINTSISNIILANSNV